jgi:hypothetical protein
VVEKERVGVRSEERGVSGRWGVDGTGWHWMALDGVGEPDCQLDVRTALCGIRTGGPDLTDCTMARAARAPSSSSECDGSI